MSDDRSTVRYSLRFAAVCLLALAPLLALALSASAVEALYVPWVGYPMSRLLTGITGAVPFSLAEWIEGAVGIGLAAGVTWLAVQWRRGRLSWRDALVRGVSVLAALTSFVVLLFYVTWGLHYGRPPASERLGWPAFELTSDDGAELAALADRLVRVTNDRYVRVHGSPDAGVVSATLAPDAIDAIADRGWATAASALDLPPRMAVGRGPAKPLLSSPVFTRLGISGFYFPFTAEANYNTMPPRWQLPHTIAHEKAHQRGIASEDEANFYGFLACVHSDDPFVEYAGFLFGQRQILRVLLQIDPDLAVPLIEARHPGVQRDVNAARAFWTGYEGAAMDLGHAMNDAYLRLNQVEGGTLSYSRAARLVVAWARAGHLDDLE